MNQASGAAQRRMKWNDIRIVGPLLVAVFAAVTFMSPNFVGASNGVGVEGLDNCLDQSVAVANLEKKEPELVRWVPCIPSPTPMPCEYYNMAAVIVTGPDGDCCIDSTPMVGGGFPPCPDPKPETNTDGDGAEGEDEEETAKLIIGPPPPAPIFGPIWLGAIDVDTSVSGFVTLAFPHLLDAFIEDNVVRVYDADKTMVFEGQIGADGTITVFSDNAPMLVSTTLTTRAPYYETVGASTTP